MIQFRLGHFSFAIIMDTYRHIAFGKDKEAAEAIPKIFWKIDAENWGARRSAKCLTKKEQKKQSKRARLLDGLFYFGGERGIRTPVAVFAANMISNHAPSTTRTPLHNVVLSTYLSCWLIPVHFIAGIRFCQDFFWNNSEIFESSLELGVNLKFLRGAIQMNDTQTGTLKSVPANVMVRGLPKSTDLGKLEMGATTDTKNTIEGTYIKVTIDGTDVLELDKYNYICSIEGTDYMAAVRTALGLN